LIATKGYTDAELPTQQTINTKLNLLGYCLTKVAKCRPQKKSAHEGQKVGPLMPMAALTPRRALKKLGVARLTL